MCWPPTEPYRDRTATAKPALEPWFHRGTVAVAFSSDVYHHFEYPMTMNASIRRALKPNGRLYVLEMEKTGSQTTHVRAPKNEVIAEIEKSGFKLVEDVKVPGLRENYLLHFQKS